MLDYIALQGSTEYPTFYTILYTILLSFLLSSLVAYTYKITSREIIIPVNFLQSMILISILSATVMQAIGDSLARGLGMLGALAIIRFRTTLKTPRNMVFTFAALTAGIACGVYGFVIAITGVVGFCLTAIILRFSPLSRATSLIGTLKFQLPMSFQIQAVESILNQYCKKYCQVAYQLGKTKSIKNEFDEVKEEHIITYEYQLKLSKLTDAKNLHNSLQKIYSIDSVKINFESKVENV